jgi:hydroxymethylpyrimidine/phosphomethylpyrimidine kinase
VADRLKHHCAEKIVLDPVMVAQSGDKLLQDDAIEAICRHLLPLADVVTPNLPEAIEMTGMPVEASDQMEAAARKLASMGGKNILVKGGHGEGDKSSDLLYVLSKDRMVCLEENRIQTGNNHGTGCTLSSAVAAYLALGNDVEIAVARAKEFITGAIEAGSQYRLGKGHGPVHHFFRYWE